ncbi:TonB family protein [Methylorubrum thiocyanatum]|jgi:TonB family protein|uniref:TonB family protein n=1 Tax=Methylorubrum thiocyanatum TaxID=47958 RepID=UPI00383A76E0
MLKRSLSFAIVATLAGGPVQSAAPLSPREREVLPSYFGMMRQWVTARMRNLRTRPEGEGTAVIRFTVQRSGRVTAATLHESSGSAEIDQAVLRALPAIGTQTRPFPKDVTRSELTFQVPVRFVP